MHTKNTQRLLLIGIMIGCCRALLLLRKSAAQLALLTFVSIIVLVSPKRLNDWSLRTISVCMSGSVVGNNSHYNNKYITFLSGNILTISTRNTQGFFFFRILKIF